jgi:hypothetical protein
MAEDDDADWDYARERDPSPELPDWNPQMHAFDVPPALSDGDDDDGLISLLRGLYPSLVGTAFATAMQSLRAQVDALDAWRLDVMADLVEEARRWEAFWCPEPDSYPHSEALVDVSHDAQTQYVPVISGLPAEVMESIAAGVAQPSTTFNRLHDVVADDGDDDDTRRSRNQFLSEFLPYINLTTRGNTVAMLPLNRLRANRGLSTWPDVDTWT